MPARVFGSVDGRAAPDFNTKYRIMFIDVSTFILHRKRC